MQVSERIRFIRKRRGVSQTQLGVEAGFPAKTAYVRVSQYETGARTPKGDLVESFARILGVSPKALSVPDITDKTSLMHTLFAIEDIYNLKPVVLGNEVYLKFDKNRPLSVSAHPLLTTWSEHSEMLKKGQITRDEYDEWRYNYPNNPEQSA